MKVAVRVDASAESGLGHAKRCLSLARACARTGMEVAFVTRDLGLDTPALIRDASFAVHVLPAPGPRAKTSEDNAPVHASWAGVSQDVDAVETSAVLAGYRPDWVVVDSYAFDARWHRAVHQHLGARLCVVDDLADRPLECALLVDHNAAPDHRLKYGRLAAGVARILGGSRFALLDTCYEEPEPCRIEPRVESIGIFMGGTDPWNGSEAAVRACREVAGFDGPIEIATTRSNPHLPALRALADRDARITLLTDAPDLSRFFARHGLQIGAGGGATWERCRVGAPTIAIVMARNQSAALHQLAEAGAVRKFDTLDVQALGNEVAVLIADPGARARLAERASSFVDGRGAMRVALAMAAETLVLRPAALADAFLVFPWRNAPATRRYFRDTSALEWEAHRAWWAQCLQDTRRHLLIGTCGTQPVGVLRLDLSQAEAEVSLYLDPALHGLGLGASLLRAGQRWIAEHGAPVEHLVAEVLPGNESSRAAFEAAGFARQGAQHWQWRVIR
jgi:UDP-2,4-diacetamido-2,4,6-trideoxy-beta-L-altropyranose hydrolase